MWQGFLRMRGFSSARVADALEKGHVSPWKGTWGQWIVNGLSVVSCLECRFMSQVYIYIYYIHIYLSYGRHGMAIEGITLPSLIGSYSLTTIPVDQHVYMIRWRDFIFRSSNKWIWIMLFLLYLRINQTVHLISFYLIHSELPYHII